MHIDPSSLTGPLGGIIAIAYGAGAASGYAFCLRTMYKILKAQADKDEQGCKQRILELTNEKNDLLRQVETLQERLIGGLERQQMQTSIAGQTLLKKRTEDGS